MALLHQGLLHDAATINYYNRARYFHFTLQKFAQRDDLKVSSRAAYHYVLSNPTKFTDSTGNAAECGNCGDACKQQRPSQGMVAKAICCVEAGGCKKHICWYQHINDETIKHCITQHEETHFNHFDCDLTTNRKCCLHCAKKYRDGYEGGDNSPGDKLRECEGYTNEYVCLVGNADNGNPNHRARCCHVKCLAAILCDQSHPDYGKSRREITEICRQRCQGTNEPCE